MDPVVKHCLKYPPVSWPDHIKRHLTENGPRPGGPGGPVRHTPECTRCLIEQELRCPTPKKSVSERWVDATSLKNALVVEIEAPRLPDTPDPGAMSLQREAKLRKYLEEFIIRAKNLAKVNRTESTMGEKAEGWAEGQEWAAREIRDILGDPCQRFRDTDGREDCLSITNGSRCAHCTKKAES